MIVYRIDIAPLQKKIMDMVKLLGTGHFPKTSEAVGKAAQLVQRKWINAVSGKVIPGADFRVQSTAYARSIDTRKIGDYESEVFATGKIPRIIEKGFRRFDMKPGLLMGPRARITLDGKRFNIIPLPNVPGRGKGSQKEPGVFWRGVGEKTDPSSWIHPGVKARPVAKMVFKAYKGEVREIIMRGVDIDVRNMIGGRAR